MALGTALCPSPVLMAWLFFSHPFRMIFIDLDIYNNIDVWRRYIDLLYCLFKEHLSGVHIALMQPPLGSLTDFLPHLSRTSTGLCTQWIAEVV